MYGDTEDVMIQKVTLPGVHKIEVPCGSRVEILHLMKAFENGADMVIVLACKPEECEMIEGSKWLERRIEHTKDLLAEAGIEPERLVLLRPQKPAAKDFEKIISEQAEILSELGSSPIKDFAGLLSEV